MPLPINIQDLFRGKSVEWERLEFKSGWNPLITLHTICAFANDFHNLGGGYIIIGVEEKNGLPVLPPIGLDPGTLDAVQKEILNLGFNAIQPYYHPIVVPVEVDGRHLLVLWVLGGQTRPYKAKLSLGKESKEYGYFIRKGSSTSGPGAPTKQNSSPWPLRFLLMTGSISRQRSRIFLVN